MLFRLNLHYCSGSRCLSFCPVTPSFPSLAAVMFNLPDPGAVKKVVHCLPRVGVGTNFGLPQTR